jgi:tetraacyldisaccharide 4'-kinase
MTRILLAPLALIYSLGILIWDFYWKHRKPISLQAKVISVGNITVGGSGKTTIAGHIAKKCISKGLKTVIVARGYKRSGSGLNILTAESYKSWEDFGDEPAALIKSNDELVVYIDSDKTAAARKASDDGFDVIIVDDGFQHRKLHRDIDIVCLDGGNPFGSGRLLPLGKLREPAKSLFRADVILIIGGPPRDTFELPGELSGIPKFNARKKAKSIRDFEGETVNIGGSRVLAFCGLGNPESFYRSLLETGCDLAGFMKFRDHHRYDGHDIRRILNNHRESNSDYIVTTLKDSVKLDTIWPADIPFYFLETVIELEREDEFFRLLGI